MPGPLSINIHCLLNSSNPKENDVYLLLANQKYTFGHDPEDISDLDRSVAFYEKANPGEAEENISRWRSKCGVIGCSTVFLSSKKKHTQADS